MKRALFALLAVLVLLPLAAVYASGPGRYDDGVITYFDSSDLPNSVRLAAQQWNRAEVGVRFQPVDDSDAADLLIVSDDARVREYSREQCAPRRSNCVAFAEHIGEPPLGETNTVVLPEVEPGEDKDPRGLYLTRLAVHELGHTLGLTHTNRRCESMNRSQSAMTCDTVDFFDRTRGGVCGPWPADIRRAAKLFGGPGTPRSPYCSG